jgi:prostaglandin reductase 3
VDSLATKGTLIVIGFISGYKDGKGWTTENEQKSKTPLPVKLLAKNAAVQGFFLNTYTSEWKRHMQLIMKLTQQGKIKITLDQGNFVGLNSIPDAIDHLLSKFSKNQFTNEVGKILEKFGSILKINLLCEKLFSSFSTNHIL